MMNTEKPWKFHPVMISFIITGLWCLGIVVALISTLINGDFAYSKGFDRLLQAFLLFFLGITFCGAIIASYYGVLRKNISKQNHFWLPLSINAIAVISGGTYIYFGQSGFACNLIFLLGLAGIVSILIYWKDFAKEENL